MKGDFSQAEDGRSAPHADARQAPGCLRPMDFTTFLITRLNALQQGLLLCLVASGLMLIFGILSLINLGRGGFYMIGTYKAHGLAPVLAHTLGDGCFAMPWVGLVLAAYPWVAVLFGIGAYAAVLLSPQGDAGHAALPLGASLAAAALCPRFIGGEVAAHRGSCTSPGSRWPLRRWPATCCTTRRWAAAAVASTAVSSRCWRSAEPRCWTRTRQAPTIPLRWRCWCCWPASAPCCWPMSIGCLRS